MINIHKVKLTILQQEILRLFFVNAGKQLNAHRIAKNLSVSQPAVAKALPVLEKEDLLKLKRDKETNRFSIELNRENHKVIGLKRVDNLKQIYESGLIEYLYNAFQEATILLFGSYSLGEDTIDSDIDLAIIGSNPRQIDIKKFEKHLQREINLQYFNSFKEIDKYLLNNVLNGITLKGSIEL